MAIDSPEEFRKLIWSKEFDPLFDSLREERAAWEQRNLSYRDLLVAVSLLSYLVKTEKQVNEAASKLFTALRDRHSNNLDPDDFVREFGKLSYDLPSWVKPALEAAISIGKDSERSNLATQGAQARHAENTAMREQAIQYYMQHASEFTSMDAAAAAIAEKVVPMTHRTVYEWIRQHRKEIQSAGKL